MAEWWNVNKRVRVYSGHAASAQKQGWINAPAGLLQVDEYKGSIQFWPEQLRFDGGGSWEPEDRLDTGGYPDFFVRLEDLSKEPYVDPLATIPPEDNPMPEPDDVPPPPVFGDVPTDAEIGRVVRYLKSL